MWHSPEKASGILHSVKVLWTGIYENVDSNEKERRVWSTWEADMNGERKVVPKDRVEK